jgi:hypothetical protein
MSRNARRSAAYPSSASDLIKQNASGAELGPVLDMIENAVRADQAKLIKAEAE